MEITALASAEDCLPGEQMEALLKTVASWKNTTTVIIHGGCVFEFKGRFPEGQVGHGYYNLHSAGGGFEGHLSLSAVASIGFQDKPHRGQKATRSCLMMRKAMPFLNCFWGGMRRASYGLSKSPNLTVSGRSSRCDASGWEQLCQSIIYRRV